MGLIVAVPGVLIGRILDRRADFLTEQIECFNFINADSLLCDLRILRSKRDAFFFEKLMSLRIELRLLFSNLL